MTRDLAAHLVLREHDPLAGPGLVLPGPWAGSGGTAEESAGAQRLRRARRDDPIGIAPGFFRLGCVRRIPNLNEFFVHHEDVRRANGRGPRVNGPGTDEALWRNVPRAPWFLARRLVGGLELQWSGTARIVRARRGEPTALIAGSPGELLLYLFGRQAPGHVELTGPALAINAVRHTHIGM